MDSTWGIIHLRENILESLVNNQQDIYLEAHFNLILFINTVSWLKEIKNTSLCGTCDIFIIQSVRKL